MQQVIKFMLLGLGSGAIYALAAQGIVLIYRGSGVLNFGQGALALLAAGTFIELRDTLSTIGAFIVAVGLAALAGALVHLLVMRPLRNASGLMRLIATLGLLVVFQQAALLKFGTTFQFVQPFLFSGSWQPIHGVIIGADRLELLVIACMLTAALWAVYRFTDFGLATSAVAEEPRSLAVLGWSPDRIATLNWLLGGALAGAAGVLLLPVTGFAPDTLTLLVLPAIAAALVGQFRSFPLTLAGGVLIGILQSELDRFTTTPGLSSSVPFLIIIGVLVLRGKSLPVRGHTLDRLPMLGTGRVRWSGLAVALALAFGSLGLFTADWADAVTSTMCAAMIALSLVVVTGYCGQLSLAQLGLAGVGALIAGRVSDVYHVPFLVALVLAGIATIPVGLLIGLPAVRTRGVNLAIATLGLATAIDELVLSNASLTGGPFRGTVVPNPELFGWNIASVARPGRYAGVVIVVFTVAALAVANLRRGATGRRMIAVRANERAAAALGINVVATKLYAFGLAAGIAGSGGALLALRYPNVDYSGYDVFGSINAVLTAVIGGIGYAIGPVFGGSIAAGGVGQELVEHLFELKNQVVLVSGILLLLTVLANPNGMASTFAQIGSRGTRQPGKRSKPLLPRQLPATPRARTPRPSGSGLEVRGLTVYFGGVAALSELDLEVRPGEIVGLIGPNGAGKTTLIDAVTGYSRPHSGQVLLNGRAIDRWSASRRARAGLGRSFQSLELFEDMTIGDNLLTAADSREMVALVRDLFWPSARRPDPQVLAEATAFRLNDRLQSLPSELPLGQRRLAGVARAVVADPEILLLDEPAAGLDPDDIHDLQDSLRRLVADRGLGVLLVEHDTEMVMNTCDRVVVIDFGRLVASGSPAEIATDPAVISAYLGVQPDSQSAAGVPVHESDS